MDENEKQLDYQFYRKNFIGQVLKIVGVVVMVISIICGAIIAGSFGETFSMSVLIIFALSGIFCGTILIGIGELIQIAQDLLHQSKSK